MKGSGCFEDIYTDTISVEHKRVFKPYSAGTQVNGYHNGKRENKTRGSMLGQISQMFNKTLT